MSNTADVIFSHANDQPDRIAVRAGERRITFAALRDAVAAFAWRVREAGIAPGDRVLLVAPTIPEFVAAYYGLYAGGATLITIKNPAASSGVLLQVSGDTL